MSYQVFVRDWWKPNPDWPDGREPWGGAPKHKLCKVETESEAREICAEYNFTHRPGKMSRKAEYEDV